MNGAFADATPRGHVAKAYLPGDQFFAYDWTVPADQAAGVSLVDEGVRLAGNVFIQQHFGGSDAPDRQGEFFHMTLVGHGTGTLRAELRANTTGDSSAESYTKTITFDATTPTTVDLSAAALGVPSGVIGLRSVRLWASAGADLTLSRVSVYATNGVEARNIHIVPAGDDVLSPMDAVALLNAGDDGKYSFLVGMAADNGDLLPTKDAWVCLYNAQTAIADMGFPNNFPDMCADAYVQEDSPAITKTRVGDAFRFDIDAAAVKRPSMDFPGFALYATVKVDGSYDLETPAASAEFKSGYFHAGRLAADAANAGVGQEFFGPTPLLVDANADGKPDWVQTQDMDGYSVIITPQYSTELPLATIVTTDTAANYVFDVQVYKYEGTSGAPMVMQGGISFGMFDAGALPADGTANVDDDNVFRAQSRHLSRVDAYTWRVTIPAAELPTQGPLGAWAFHNVGNAPHANAFGSSTSSTDYYSALRNSVKDSPIADAMRSAMTPIVLDGASLTRDATFVIRADADADEITALDGTLVIGDKDDGTITLEYALVVPDGRTITPNRGHGLAIYDAAGAASDDLAPGPARMEHAEYWARGTLQPDGWFRLDIPVSAFGDAKGAVGAWGWADNLNGDGFLLSRDGWYNVLKAPIAAASTSAAEAALYTPTPIVVLDEQLGIPKALASSLAGIGTDLLSVTNPLVNPGFEADIIVEGRNDRPDATGAVMTAPPWFLRLDDEGTQQPTDPKSTHSVVAGKGRLGDNALKVSYNVADKDKSLMLGQLLGTEQGGDALVWRGASGVSFDVYPVGSTDVTFQPYLRYMLADGTVAGRSATTTYGASGEWGRVSLPLANVPADARLLGLYLVINAPSTTTFYLDNVVLEGAKTALGDTRSDLTDGFAVVIEPANMVGPTQELVQTADGQYYMYTVEVVDYTQGSPRALDVASLDKAFALRTEQLQKGGGILVPLRARTDAFVALVPAGDVPADAAVPWAFVSAGEPFATMSSDFITHPASGHYNPLKNALAGMPLADQLDYAATPVVFSGTVGSEEVYDQAIELTDIADGLHGVRVVAGSPYVETTMLTLTAPGGETSTYVAPIDGVVPGLELTDEDLETVTLTTSDTRFTRGDELIAGSPIARFEVCRPDQDGCLDAGILTGESLTFRSTSLSPTGEALTLVWAFGDGAVATQNAPQTETTHTYARPGSKSATLTVSTPSGKSASATKDIVVNNQAPVLQRIVIQPDPTAIYTDSLVRLRALASDADGGSLSYTWSINEVEVANVRAAQLTLTAAVLEQTTGVAALEQGDYAVAVSIADGQNGVTSGTTSFTVLDRPASLAAPLIEVEEFGGSYALPGDSVAFATLFEDLDSVPARVALTYTLPGGAPTSVDMTDAGEGAWTLDRVSVGPVPGDLVAFATAYAADASVLVTSPSTTLEVRENAPPVVTIDGPASADIDTPTTYFVSASDPDGRAVGSIELDGVLGIVDNGDGSYVVVFDAIGETTLTASAVDANGAEGTDELLVEVDDAIYVAMEVIHEPTTERESYLVRITVTDVNGDGIGGARVVVEDFYSMIPTAIETQEVITDGDGTIVVRLRPEAIVIGLPLTRTVIATATADSLPDAAVQDEETASTELQLRNDAGALGGLPLP